MRNFKRAVAVTLLCALCVGVIFGAVSSAYFCTQFYYYEDAQNRKELAGEIDFLFCGSSHCLRAFSPEEIDPILGCNSYNLAGSLMTMKGRYTLLRKELSRNDVSTVVVELSYNALARDRKEEGPEGDIYMLARMDNAAESLLYAVSSFRPNEYDRVLYDTMERSVNSLLCLLRGQQPTDVSAQKGWFPAGVNDCSTTVEKYNASFHKAQINESINEENLRYLEKILDLCKTNGVRIIFVVTPISDRYLGQYGNMDTVIGRYAEIARENGCEFYDFNLLKEKDLLLPCETAFYDDAHLSSEGAKAFSQRFAEIISAVDSGQSVDGLFYDSYDEADRHSRYYSAADAA